MILLLGGLAAARRAWRWRILLAGSAWRPYRLTYLARPQRLRYPGLALEACDDSGPPLLLRLRVVFR